MRRTRPSEVDLNPGDLISYGVGGQLGGIDFRIIVDQLCRIQKILMRIDFTQSAAFHDRVADGGVSPA